MNKYKTFAIRVVALIAYEGLATFGLSAGVGIEPIKGALMAALLPLVVVIRETARNMIDDGKLSQKEMDEVITAAKSAKKK
ncbi:hypothetical protein UFOVP722_8 [uncultured Caudovirales phage]|jgi:hypothetical protein|uniref:Uncharacterized protein n=1 Tax=uncultured Caudovirales phage TaxID=2100421 RepID=A0A6J5NLR5_9CAUD|nr:hypothetical protein UFOVP722_8 [uncultured Caudovirales phage]